MEFLFSISELFTRYLAFVHKSRRQSLKRGKVRFSLTEAGQHKRPSRGQEVVWRLFYLVDPHVKLICPVVVNDYDNLKKKPEVKKKSKEGICATNVTNVRFVGKGSSLRGSSANVRGRCADFTYHRKSMAAISTTKNLEKMRFGNQTPKSSRKKYLMRESLKGYFVSILKGGNRLGQNEDGKVERYEKVCRGDACNDQ